MDKRYILENAAQLHVIVSCKFKYVTWADLEIKIM